MAMSPVVLPKVSPSGPILWQGIYGIIHASPSCWTIMDLGQSHEASHVLMFILSFPGI
jgi:hypothetical protein